MFIKDHDLDGIVKIGYVTATCGLTSALYLLGMNEWFIWLKFHLVDILLCNWTVILYMYFYKCERQPTTKNLTLQMYSQIYNVFHFSE